MEDSQQEGMKAANFRIALEHLRRAQEALNKTPRTDLAVRVKKIGKEIVGDASKTLPSGLATELSDYDKKN